MKPGSRVVRGICIGGIVLLSGCVSAPTDVEQGPLLRTAFSGTPQRIGFFYEVNPDCTSAGLPTLRIKQQPAHGAVELGNAQDYTSFNPGSQRYDCNKQKSPGIAVSYTSQSGYIGPDQVLLEAVYTNGHAKTVSYSISVE